MFAAQNAVFKELLREQRKCYDGALSAVMNEILVALGESEVKMSNIPNYETIHTSNKIIR